MWCLALSLNTYTKYIIISDEFTFTLFTLWEKLYFFQDNNPEGGAKTLVWQSISISWPLKPIKNQLALDPTSTVSLKIWTIEHKDYKRAVSSPFNTPQLHVDGVTSCRCLNVKREKWNGVREEHWPCVIWWEVVTERQLVVGLMFCAVWGHFSLKRSFWFITTFVLMRSENRKVPSGFLETSGDLVSVIIAIRTHGQNKVQVVVN